MYDLTTPFPRPNEFDGRRSYLTSRMPGSWRGVIYHGISPSLTFMYLQWIDGGCHLGVMRRSSGTISIEVSERFPMKSALPISPYG